MQRELPSRKRNRMECFDYSSDGAYFITICTKHKQNILSSIAENGDASNVVLTDIGKIAEKHLVSSNHINGISVEQLVIMPNHIHAIVFYQNNNVSSDMPSIKVQNAVIPRMISAFKRFCNQEIGENIFQRSYHDHVIRSYSDYEKISAYIYENPMKWNTDCFYNADIL